MECPKCHKKIPENINICPHCKKVLSLECPNCKTKTQSAVCEQCGFIILEKCAKCGRMVPTNQIKCKCGFSVKTSIASQECETDEFVSVIIKFNSLNKIKKILKTSELFDKFYYKLKNLLTMHFKSIDGNIIKYNDVFVVNFNKELSLQTSSEKALRFAIKIMNAFCTLNKNVAEEFLFPLDLTITLIRKTAENLLDKDICENKFKLLTVKKQEKKYLKGLQIILDQHVHDCISKTYKTDSLYSTENEGILTMYYELILDSYILPPSENHDEQKENIGNIKPVTNLKSDNNKNPDDIYDYNVFDINAKCKFAKISAQKFFTDFEINKIVSFRGKNSYRISTSDLIKYYEAKGFKVVHLTCSEELNFKPWGALEHIYRDYSNLSFFNEFVDKNALSQNKTILSELLLNKPIKASSAEDARFAYIEAFELFFKSLKNCAVIIENFEHLDDSSLQVLQLYFDRYKMINTHFVFTTNKDVSLHSKIKSLLQTTLYTEYVLQKNSLNDFLAQFKSDAADFINSFYFEKINENYKGSLIYCDNAIQYLKETDILIDFENKLFIRNNNSVVLPLTLEELIKARLKYLSKNIDASLILAYSVFLGDKLDFALLETLGVKSVSQTVNFLENSGWVIKKENHILINNYDLIKSIMLSSLKKEIEEFLLKNIVAKLGKNLDTASMALIMGNLSIHKEEYLLLWKNSQFAMAVGDYDAYLKNCLGFLALIECLSDSISQEDIEENKTDVFQNILMNLYTYSPTKIYTIEKVLLLDAMAAGDNDRIVKLSNIMLQGALITSNYTEARGLLYNILTRLENPELIVDGKINSGFLLLSLVNIEILFNIGDNRECINIAQKILSVLKPDLIEKIKPASFSVNLFVEHLLDTFRMVAFAILFLQEDSLEEFFNSVEQAIGEEFPDKDVIYTIKDFMEGKPYIPSQVEHSSVFSKVIYLILQEFSEHAENSKVFAQNIYQAKLLANDIHQRQIELFCDLLIAYSYYKIGIHEKADFIYNDILKISQDTSNFNILNLTKYFIAIKKIHIGELKDALLIVNDVLATLHIYKNKILFVLFEQLLIKIVKRTDKQILNLESEEKKLELASTGLSRLISI